MDVPTCSYTECPDSEGADHFKLLATDAVEFMECAQFVWEKLINHGYTETQLKEPSED